MPPDALLEPNAAASRRRCKGSIRSHGMGLGGTYLLRADVAGRLDQNLEELVMALPSTAQFGFTVIGIDHDLGTSNNDVTHSRFVLKRTNAD